MKESRKKKFIEKSIKKHGNKYDYSFVDYIIYNKNVKIYCNNCKEFFWQTPIAHLQGLGHKKCNKPNKKYDTKKFIEKSKQKFGNKFNYHFTTYTYSNKNLILICKIHGFIIIQANHHLNNTKKGCPECGFNSSKKNRRLKINYIIKKSKIIHGNVYNFKKAKYKGAHKKLIVTCKKHGDFETTASNLLNHECGCPNCYNYNSLKKLYKKNYFYIIKLYNISYVVDKNKLCFHDDAIKFGISYKPKKRFSRIKNKLNGNIKILAIYSSTYKYIIDLEKQIKRKFQHRNGYLSKEILFDGYTETLPNNNNILKKIINYCNEDIFLTKENIKEFV